MDSTTAQKRRVPPTPAMPLARGLLQRKCACGGTSAATGECAECQQRKLLQRRPSGASAPVTVPSIVHDVLRSPGQPLDSATRGYMEPRFGHDFGAVRVHTNSLAAESARAVNALAYTVGQSIVFGRGLYAPGSSSGRRLMAHELTHVVQQRFGALDGTAAPGDIRLNDPSVRFEHEASALADRVVGADSATIGLRQDRRPSPPLQPVQRTMLPTVQRYGTPIPTVAHPTVVTMRQYIDLVRRVEVENPGLTALQIAQRLMRSKYHSQGFDWLLPSTAGTSGVSPSGGVTSGDVTTLSGEFDVTLPQGGVEDASHVVTAIVAAAERLSPGAGGAGGLLARTVSAPPAGLTQLDIASWAGDPGSAAGEWMTVHPHPNGGTTMQNYMDEFSPESDIIGDVDGVAMTSTSAATGFVFDHSIPLSDNLERFYFPTAPREGKNRRFHTFCSVLGFGLQPDGITLAGAAINTIDNRIKAFADWYMANDPNILAWMALNSPSPSIGGNSGMGVPLYNPIYGQWISRANDWRWFAQKFRDFVQRNLNSEGP